MVGIIEHALDAEPISRANDGCEKITRLQPTLAIGLAVLLGQPMAGDTSDSFAKTFRPLQIG
ncbi:MAG: hypothetical protein R3B96_11550 [Pirellulaceae bacterium]